MPKRARGRRRIRTSGADAFERLVDRALASIPSPFRESLAEVAVVIEDWPSDDQLEDNDLDLEDVLYGLYEGVPRTEWAADSAVVPNRITLFRIPLEEDFPDPRDLAEEVRITVIHELAHHLGIDDDRLQELGVG
ncbi:MAG: metallopeptidase family protein [Chloroflexota bacterium]|nr:MAG: metallopeptidase family protein [Chloroflexota bacterium]